MAKAYGLDSQTGKRVIHATQWVESQPTGYVSPRVAPVVGQTVYRAEITGKHSTDPIYTWTALRFNPDTKQMVKDTTWGEGTLTSYPAICENNASPWIPNGMHVELRPALNANYYLFYFTGSLKAVVASGGITARSGSTAGFGNVTLKKFSTAISGTLGDYATTTTLKVWNWSDTSYITSQYIGNYCRIDFDVIDGTWSLDSIEC